MSAPSVEKIANAVLYEGYLLYPYRSTAVKNRQRWNFGVVYPRAYSEQQQGAESYQMETQCLVSGGLLTELTVKVRCLRLVDRITAYLNEPVLDLPRDKEPEYLPKQWIEVNGEIYESWQEAAECEMRLPPVRFAILAAGRTRRRFSFPATRFYEPLRNDCGLVAGLIVRKRDPLECWIEMSVETVREGLFRVTVRISNLTPCSGAALESRDGALGGSLLSAHTILSVCDGEFISLLEPPGEYQQTAAACHNAGTWPVLVGEPGRRDTVLSSPIILYDYPQVAPESPGDLFDGAEIDEILALRILTLTDEEKAAMRRSDQRAKDILERTESLPPEHFMKLHGALRGMSAGNEEAQ